MRPIKCVDPQGCDGWFTRSATVTDACVVRVLRGILFMGDVARLLLMLVLSGY